MPIYVIASHGAVEWRDDETTLIPANTTVLFYTPFGKCISNKAACDIQAALCHRDNIHSATTLEYHKTVALWNGPHKQKPGVWLTPDDNGKFKSGIVLADTNEVIYAINKGQMVSLTWALQQISNHANGAQADVHCLFCLAS